MNPRRNCAKPASLLAAAALAVATGGCAGSNFASELAAKPKPHPLAGPGPQTWRLPQDQPFSIARHESQQQAELDGSAAAEASAGREGQAAANARACGGGQARATFQLGHAFANASQRQMDLDVALRCAYEYEARAQPPAPWPDATVGLKLYARDGRNRLLRSFTLVGQTTEQGNAASRDRKTFRFTVTLGPGESVNLFLAGQVAVDVPPQRSAQAALRLGELEMELETRPAPATRTAADVPG